MSEHQVSHVTTLIVIFFVKKQYEDKTLYVGYSGSKGQPRRTHMDEVFQNTRLMLQYKNGKNLKVEDMYSKYGAEVHFVYCSRIDYNGVRVEARMQNTLENHMEMATKEAFQRPQPKGTRLFFKAQAVRERPNGKNIYDKGCCKVFILKLDIKHAILSGELKFSEKYLNRIPFSNGVQVEL